MRLTHKIRPAAIGVAGAILLVAVIAGPASAGTKPYATDIAPHSVVAGSTSTFTATLSNENGTNTTIQLGSANITPPTGFIVTAVSAPVPGGTAAVVNNVVQLRMLGIQPQQSGSVQITARVPALTGSYTWSITARQSNDFNGTGNTLNLDAAHSNLNTTVSAAAASDLAVSQTDSLDPVAPGGDVQYFVTARNNGPNGESSVRVDDTTTGGSSILSASGTGWTCTTNSATSVTCTYGALAANSAANTLTILAQAPNPAPTGQVTCGSTTATGIVCNTATVSGSIPDNITSNNMSSEPTTVNVSSTGPSASGYVPEARGATVTLPQVTTVGNVTQTIGGTTTFPALAGNPGSFVFTMAAIDPQVTCPVNAQLTQCTFEMSLTSTAANGGIPADYTGSNKVEVLVRCAITTCHSPTNTYLLFKLVGNNVQAILDCSLGGSPCQKGSPTIDNVNGWVTFDTFWLGGDPNIAGKCIPAGSC